MAVDTHVFRVSHRLGLVSDKCTTPFSVEKELVKHIPEADIPIAHHWLILHGRYVCQARTPQCDTCGLQLMCKYYCQKYKVSKEERQRQRINNGFIAKKEINANFALTKKNLITL